MTKKEFAPHAIIICERSTPTSIHSAGWVGISNLLRLNLDTQQGENSFIQQALDGLVTRLGKYDCEDWRGQIPWFGYPAFLVVNYDSDRAIRYDLNGTEIEHLNGVVETGYSAETIHLANKHLRSKREAELVS